MNTIGNIFTRGCASRENITDGVHSMKYISIFHRKKKKKQISSIYFMLSGRISGNSSENIFRSYTGTTSENIDFHVLVV